jgi:hypothetical protein
MTASAQPASARCGPSLGGQGFAGLGVEVIDQEPRSRRRQPPDGRRPDAAGAAGDDRGPVLEMRGHPSASAGVRRLGMFS